jgi:hypothetical protein
MNIIESVVEMAREQRRKADLKMFEASQAEEPDVYKMADITLDVAVSQALWGTATTLVKEVTEPMKQIVNK